MLTGELRNKIDRLWETFWTGGITNPLDVVEQMTYLMACATQYFVVCCLIERRYLVYGEPNWRGGTLLSQKGGVSMARLTNEEIRRMTIDQADAYTDAHPAEAWRFVKAYGAAAAQQTKKAVKHGLRKGMLVPEPEVIELA